MKKLAFAVFALAAILLMPGLAHAYPKQGWYAGLGAGLSFQEDMDVTSGATSDKLEFDPGFAVAGSVGFGFENQFRPEFEISYRRSTVSKATGTGSGSATGNVNAIAFMGNLFYDFDTHTGFTPYIGLGLGGALVGADNAGNVFSGDNIDSQPVEFAYQGIAGFSFELSERLDATLDYRYFRTMRPDFKTVSGASVTNDDYINHTVMVGLRYIMGVEKPLPAPVAMREAPRAVVVMPAPAPMAVAQMPPPPMAQMPPPPPPMAVPETYIVFFDFDKYYLTPEAKETLQRAADAFKAGGVARVEVTGHTDTVGSYRYNKRLSDRRARVVKEYLIALGVPGGEISTRGVGFNEPMVPTGSNVREAKNRRAEIIMRQ